MDKANTIKEEETDAGRTTATLAGVGAGPEVQVAAASHFGSSSVSITGVATAPAKDEQAAPLFLPEEAKDFHAPCDAIQASFVDEPGDRSWNKQIVLLQQR
ncbi:MAG: hypothetical protein WBV48_00085 [Candidatus Acidiferrales bacterium]